MSNIYFSKNNMEFYKVNDGLTINLEKILYFTLQTGADKWAVWFDINTYEYLTLEQYSQIMKYCEEE